MIRTATLLLALCLATPAAAHGPEGHGGSHGHAHPPATGASGPSIDMLRASVQCELDATDKLIKAALPHIHDQPVAMNGYQAAIDSRAAALELVRTNELALATKRSREARKQLKAVLDPLWGLKKADAVHGHVETLLGCARARRDVTRAHLQSHPLIGPRTALDKANERLEKAGLALRQHETRMAFFQTEDGLHQLDVGIGTLWPTTRDEP